MLTFVVKEFVFGLNPCFTGICSLRVKYSMLVIHYMSLNPCFTGICSLRQMLKYKKYKKYKVLILVLLEYAL